MGGVCKVESLQKSMLRKESAQRREVEVEIGAVEDEIRQLVDRRSGLLLRLRELSSATAK